MTTFEMYEEGEEKGRMEDGGKIRRRAAGRLGPKFYYARNIFFSLVLPGNLSCPAMPPPTGQTPLLHSGESSHFHCALQLVATEHPSKTFFFCPAAGATGGRFWWGVAGR
jgi:hypothetical protein